MIEEEIGFELNASGLLCFSYKSILDLALLRVYCARRNSFNDTEII